MPDKMSEGSAAPRVRGGATERKPPFFIVGCSRSGTTLLQALIDGHPDIAIPPESQIYRRFGPVFASYGSLAARQNRAPFVKDLLSDVYIRQWRLDVTPEDVEQRLARFDRVGIIEAMFTLYAEKSGARRWGDKTPDHILHLPEIKADFPHAKLIHLVRDGRDVAEAKRRMIWGPVTAFGLAHEWRREVMLWQQFCTEHGTDGTLVVRYEDLVTAPQETLEKILDFLGEPYVDTVSSYASTPLSRTLSSTQSAWHSSLRRGISTKKIGVYRREFTRREIEILEEIAGDALAAYGYELDHSAPRPATLRHRCHAFFADRVVRWWRKLLRPAVIWLELQFRLRLAHRRLVGGLRNEAE